MKLTKTIIIKRTNIETYKDEEDNISQIDLKLLVYEEGNESATLDCDEDSWMFHKGTWSCQSRSDYWSGLPYGLWTYIGIDNTPLLDGILTALTDNEYITVTYTTEVNIQPGHSLRTCGMCAFWENGKCSRIGEELEECTIIPCANNLFKKKETNNAVL